MDATAHRTWHFLLRHCRGREHARTKRALAAALGMAPRAFERAVHALVTVHRRPIAAASDRPPMGYFVPASEAERAHALAVLEHRVGEIHQRIRALAAAELPRPPAEGLVQTTLGLT